MSRAERPPAPPVRRLSPEEVAALARSMPARSISMAARAYRKGRILPAWPERK